MNKQNIYTTVDRLDYILSVLQYPHSGERYRDILAEPDGEGRVQRALTLLQGASESFHLTIDNYLLVAVQAALTQFHDISIEELGCSQIASAIRFGDHSARYIRVNDVSVTFPILPLEHAVLVSLIRWYATYKKAITALTSDNVDGFVIATRVLLHPTLVFDVHEARLRWQDVGAAFMPMSYVEANKLHSILVSTHGESLKVFPIVRAWCSLVDSKLGEHIYGSASKGQPANIN